MVGKCVVTRDKVWTTLFELASLNASLVSMPKPTQSDATESGAQ